MGYIECRLEENVSKPVSALSKAEILGHYGGDLTEQDINSYPRKTVYSFRATAKGREESVKDIYNVYYPKKK